MGSELNAGLALAPLEGVPLWRREPYRPFFALGIGLAWAGVGQWLLYAARLTDYRVTFHAMALVQGFLACFITGFLFTFIPRRTFGSPPSPWQMVVGLLCPAGLTVAAWLSAWAWAQAFWLCLMALLLQFALGRMLWSRNDRPAPPTLLWVPLSLGMGILSSIATGVAAMVGAMWLHDIFRGLLLQGVVAGLLMGVGGMLVPVITRAEPPRGTPSARQRALQLLWALLFYASFFVEHGSPRLGFALRAAVCVGVLVVSAQLWRTPTKPGLNRWLVWCGAWCLPLGYVAAAAFPDQRFVALHVVFVGAFGMTTLGVGLHVVLTHANHPELLAHRTLRGVALTALLAGALICRLLMGALPEHHLLFMAAAATLFLGATAFWLSLALPFFGLSPAAPKPAAFS